MQLIPLCLWHLTNCSASVRVLPVFMPVTEEALAAFSSAGSGTSQTVARRSERLVHVSSQYTKPIH